MTGQKVKTILAVVTVDGHTASGGSPIFLCRDDRECQQVAGTLSRILDAMAHSLENGTYIIVSQ